MATKQAQEIAQGKTFEEVKYDHSLSKEFPQLANPHQLLSKIYSFMANIEHNQLLLSKLASANNTETKEIAQASTETVPAEKASPSTEQ
jgi:hypothetical protein